MSTERYFGSWGDRAGVLASFEEEEEGFPTDADILFASYGGGAYDGDALVIYEQDGVLYEAHGSHCSCYGLEGQWSPEETSWAALAKRSLYEHGKDADDALAALIAGHTAPETAH